mmetsp:Transcript_99863/g.250334  ORF Transcript_99863/g.250334 Transcript_99863/m.250334 type:complete len:86 (+) Transcript_99863:683-940(+)
MRRLAGLLVLPKQCSRDVRIAHAMYRQPALGRSASSIRQVPALATQRYCWLLRRGSSARRHVGRIGVLRMFIFRHVLTGRPLDRG